jgi:hypothetical protein
LEATRGKQFSRLHLQVNQSKTDWRCVSSGRVPRARSPEFKPQFHTQKKNDALDTGRLTKMRQWGLRLHSLPSQCPQASRAYLSAADKYWVPMGLSTRPPNLWPRRRQRTRPRRANLRPVQRRGSQWPSSHMASGQGSAALPGPPSSSAASGSMDAAGREKGPELQHGLPRDPMPDAITSHSPRNAAPTSSEKASRDRPGERRARPPSVPSPRAALLRPMAKSRVPEPESRPLAPGTPGGSLRMRQTPGSGRSRDAISCFRLPRDSAGAHVTARLRDGCAARRVPAAARNCRARSVVLRSLSSAVAVSRPRVPARASLLPSPQGSRWQELQK